MSLEWKLAHAHHMRGDNFDCHKEIERLFAEERDYQNAMIERLDRLKRGREEIKKHIEPHSKEYDEIRKKTREIIDEIAKLSPMLDSDGQPNF